MAVAAAAGPAVRRAAHAALDRARRGIARRMPLAPADLLGAHLEVPAPTARSGASGGRLRRRSSSGSSRSRSASSSITISVMKQDCGCPGARNARCGPGVDVHVRVPLSPVPGTRRRGRGPGSWRPARRRRCPTSRRRHAVSLPCASTPARTFAKADGRLPVTRCSSLRSSISFTGASAALARRAQITT